MLWYIHHKKTPRYLAGDESLISSETRVVGFNCLNWVDEMLPQRALLYQNKSNLLTTSSSRMTHLSGKYKEVANRHNTMLASHISYKSLISCIDIVVNSKIIKE